MGQSILLKRSAIPGKKPSANSLNLGEIALNTYDGRIFFKRSGSLESVEEVITTNAVNTGSINLYGGVDNQNYLLNITGYNNYFQGIYLQNLSNSTSASSDIAIYNDDGTSYIDIGINSTTYQSSSEAFTTLGKDGDAYVFSAANDLYIGNASTGKRVILFNGDFNTEENAKITIHDQGSLVINTGQSYNQTYPEALVINPRPDSNFNLVSVYNNVNNYSQINTKNFSSGPEASTDIVTTADNGDEVLYYTNLGINSSQYSAGNVGYANDGYLIHTGKNFYIGTKGDDYYGTNPDANLYLFANSDWDTPEIMISGSHVVGFGTQIVTDGYKYEFDGGNVKINNDVLVLGTITAQNLVVQTITSSTQHITGSTRFGSSLTNTHDFTGSVRITSSLTVNGPIDINGDSTIQGNQFNAGTYWKAISGSNFPSLPWRGIAYGNGLFVAVASRGGAGISTTESIATSPDGVNWTFRTIPSITNLTNITYQNGMFIAIGAVSQRAFYSYDGINWANATNMVGIVYGITYGKDKFVACKIDNPGFRINISYDGKNWQGVSTPSTMDLSWTSVTYANDRYVAVAESTVSGSIAISYDGLSWNNVTRPSAGTLTTYTVTYGKGLFVVTCSQGKIMTSPDGINWTVRDTPLTGLIWKCIFAEGVFIAAGAFSTTENRFIYSTDGITWEEATTPALNSWSGFAYGNGLLVAVSFNGTDSNALVVSSGVMNSFVTQNDNITHGRQTFTDDVIISASLNISGSQRITGNLIVSGGITGSLLATNGVVSGSSQIDLTQTTGYTSFSQSLSGTDSSQSVNILAVSQSAWGAFQSASAFSSSAATIDNIQNVRLNSVEGFTASVAETNTFTASTNASLIALNTSTASLNSKTGSYATTGSNVFQGNQTINGTLNVTNIVVTTITASTEYASGSTRFGSSNANTHEFTGSVRITGSLDVVGGVIATSFGGTINANNGVVSGSSQIDLTQTTGYTAFSQSLAGTDASQSVSILATSQSAWGAFQSASAFSSSAASVDNAQNVRLNSIENFTSSVANVNVFTQSVSLRLNALETSSASVIGRVGSIESFTSSFSSSNFQINVTQSVRLNSIETFTSSIAGTNTFTASIAATNTFTASVNTSLNSINLKTGSYATTGSNQFIGNQTITGSLIVSGTTGTTLLSSNVDTLLLTGSAIITGSLIVTGSLSVSGFITGSLLSTNGVISGSSQVTLTSTTGYTTFSQSLAGTDESQSVSILISSQSAWGAFQSASAFSSSAATVDNTQNVRLNSLESFTASVTNINQFTQSVNNSLTALNLTTSSLNNFTASVAGTNTFTASTNVSLTALNLSTASLTSRTGSYATTGSNTFQGNQTINGTLNVTNIVVTTITASTEFASGSTRFGSNNSNTHEFTGSVRVTGSLEVIGNVTATSFAGTINANNGVVSGSSQITLTQTTGYTAFSQSLAGTDESQSVSILISSQSAFGAFQSASAFSSSAATVDNGQNVRLNSLEVFTSSITNINSFTASTNASLIALNASTASLNSKTGSYATTGSNNFIGNQQITGSLNLSGSVSEVVSTHTISTPFANGNYPLSLYDGVYNFNFGFYASGIGANRLSIYRNSSQTYFDNSSGNFYFNAPLIATSFAGTINANNGVVSGSSQIDITQTTAYTAFSQSLAGTDTSQSVSILIASQSAFGAFQSASAFSSSAATVDNAQNVRLNTIESFTASAENSLTALNLATASLTSKTGSYATTGSNTFQGNQTINGTLNVTNIVVTTITASTEFASGSTRFGSNNSNTHEFTGSVSITGSLNLPYISAGSILFAGTNGVVSQNNSNLFWDNANSRLGIRTTSPTGALHVAGQFYVNNGGSIGQVIEAVNHVGGTSYMYLQAGGSDSYISSTGTNSFNILNTTRIGLGSSNSVPWLGMTSTGTYIGFNSHVSPSARLHIKGSTTGSALTLLTQNSNNSASFAIKDDGNVGIGTTSPTTLLHISGTTGGLLEIDSNTAANILYVSSSGNVGVGTITPLAKLHVNGNVYVQGSGNILDLEGGAKITGQRFVNGSEFTYLRMYNVSDASINMGTQHPLGYISFEAGSGAYTERLRITNTGNVGIGTTSPSFRLDVSGSSRFTDNMIITGSLTVITGSNIEFQVTNTGIKIGNLITDAHSVTGSIGVSGSVTATNFTGSLFGTASWANNAITASTADNFIIRNSLTASLQSGYVWVGDASGISKPIATSSFATLAAAGTISSSAQVDITQTTGYTAFSQSLAGTDASQSVSITTISQSAWGAFQSASAFSSSAAIVDNVQTLRLNTIESFTSSIAGTNTFTASIAGTNVFTASIAGTNAFTQSTNLRLNSIETFTSSIAATNTFTASVNNSLTALNLSTASLTSRTGSYATTGSNTFQGNQTINGTLNVTNIVVTTITASTQYSSGSNIFGSELTNIQQFTGSLRVTGSANHWIVGSNVGIGTTNPEFNFDVSGSGRYTNTLTITGSLINGENVIASGMFSHAEGIDTIASGSHSHAEGYGAWALGPYSHAEGEYTEATGWYSHAEGTYSEAIGDYAHSEGDSAKAMGDSSHAEGYSTIAKGNASHAEGYFTITSGSYSHAEGRDTTTIGMYSHAEGYFTITSGSYSHAEGYYTTTSGSYSHAEGGVTRAIGNFSHAEGASTEAIGDYSHAEGLSTVASGAFQHVQGQYNISSSAQSAFIIGNGTSITARRNLVFASGSVFEISGSLNVSGSITGSLLATNGVVSGSSQVTLTSTTGYTTFSQSLAGTNQSASVSIVITSQSAWGAFQSASAFSSSAATVDNAQNVRLNTIETFTSSIAGTNLFTASIAATNTFTASIAGTNTFTQSANARLNSLESRTGSYATTGSNSFVGNQTITGSSTISGSLFVTGSLNAASITGSLLSSRINLTSTPTLNSTSNQILVRNTGSGDIEYSTISSLYNTRNLISVGMSGSKGVNYNSIKAAVDSITDASENNTYTVRVGPGIFYETAIAMKSWITVKGDSSTTTIVSASNPSASIFVMADQSMLIDMQIQGTTAPSASAVLYSSATTPQTNAISYVENVRFGTNYTHAKTVGTAGGNCIMQCSNVKYGGFTDSSLKSFDVGFHVSGSAGSIGRMQLRNVTSTNGGVAGSDDNQIFALADAPGCTFIVNGCLLTRAVGTARGTAFKVYNGGSLRLTAVNFQRWINGIWAPQIGSAPSIDAIALNFENCTTDTLIQHTGSIGKVSGTDNFLKTQIALSASLYEVGQDPRKIFVAKKGGDFASVSASVAYITDSSENNRYIIEVGPGAFIEKEIDLSNKPYVSVIGSDIQATEIIASGSNHNIFKLGNTSQVSFMTLRGAGTGYAALSCTDTNGFSIAHKVSIYDCDYGFRVVGNVSSSTIFGEYVDINGTFSYGTYVSSSNGTLTEANMENYYLFPSASATIGNFASGPSASLSLYTAKFLGDSTTNSTAIRLENGAQLEAAAIDIQSWDYGYVVPNTGAGPNFRVVGSMVHDTTTYDFNILNANTRGRYQGVSNHQKINNVSENFYWNFLDDEDGENDVTRKLSVTFADGTHTDATTLIFNGSPMGVMSGGEITIVSGLTISTAAGFGYCEKASSPDVVQRIDWNNSQLVLPANSESYIYINESGLTYALTEPSDIQNIIVGRVVTNNTGVEFIDQSSHNAAHTANLLSNFNREALGPVYANGSIVTENVVPKKLNITAGSYYFSENNFTPAGTSSINLNQYFRSGSSWNRSTSSVVPTNVYNSGSGGTLTPLSASAFTKHTLYGVGQGVDEKYFLVIGQNQYDTLVEAEGAGLPTPPDYFDRGVVSIASIYVQSGSSNITQIEDIRPVIGFKAGGVNASSTHGNLLGLTSDDHPQYLLTDGTRTLTGNMNLGGFNISNVSSISATSVTGSIRSNNGVVSGSSQIDLTQTTGYTAFSQSLAGTDTSQSVSILATSQSAWGAFQSASAFSSSAATVDNAQNIRLNSIENFTSSVAGTNTFTASVAGTNLFTASIAGTNTFTASVNNSLTALNLSTASLTLRTGSYATTGSNTFIGNQIISGTVFITSSLIVGSGSVSNENTLVVGTPIAGGAGEGGQILLAASGGLYTSASMIDNWQNQTRLLRGTNAGSDAVVVQWNMHTKQMQLPAYTGPSSFAGTATANLAVNSNGEVITVSTSGGSVFPYTGIAAINGGLIVTGSITASGAIHAQANGAMYFRGGDDVELWDINVANTLGVYGQQDLGVASIKLGSGGGTISGRSGSIGIGTITPNSASLHVAGNVFATSFTGSILSNNGVVSGSSQIDITQTTGYTTFSQSLAGTDQSQSVNILIASQSAFGAFQSASAFSSSAATIDNAQNIRLNSIETFTASIAGTNTFTQSVNLRLNALETSSASVISRVGSIESFTSSFSSSNFQINVTQSARLNAVETFTASVAATNTFTASIAATNTFTASIAGTNTFTASVNNSLTALNLSTASLTSKTGSYATTGSNTFQGNQTINGTLNVTNIVVTTITASTEYASGSTRFGSNNSNTHEFTGSVSITGSLDVIGGVTATSIAGTINANNGVISGSSQVTLTATTGYTTFSQSLAGTDQSASVSILITSQSAWGAFQSASAFSSSAATVDNAQNVRLNSLESFTASVAGTNTFTASVNTSLNSINSKTGSYAITGSNRFVGNQTITGSAIISGSVSIIASGSSVFTVDGVSGRLFSIDDSLSGSLFSVNTVAGLPLMEAFSDNTIRIGQYGQRALFVSQSRVGIGLENPTTNLHISGTTGGVFEVDGASAVNALYVSSSGNVGMGTTTPSASLHVLGSTTNSQYSFWVQNSSGQTLISTQNDRTVNINSTNAVGGDTNIGTTSGTINFNRGYNNTFVGNALTFYGGGVPSTIQGFNTTSGIAIGYAQTNVNPNPGSGLTIRGTTITSGSGVLFVTGSSNTRLLTLSSETNPNAFIVSGSGNVGIGTISPTNTLHVVGSTLLSGSITGSGNTLINGNLTTTGSLNVSGSNYSYAGFSTAVGANTISSIPTASYNGAFYNYIAVSGSNARAGQISAIWLGNTITYTETTTTDIGNTNGVSMAVQISSGLVQLIGTTTSTPWIIKTSINLI